MSSAERDNALERALLLPAWADNQLVAANLDICQLDGADGFYRLRSGKVRVVIAGRPGTSERGGVWTVLQLAQVHAAQRHLNKPTADHQSRPAQLYGKLNFTGQARPSWVARDALGGARRIPAHPKAAAFISSLCATSSCLDRSSGTPLGP